MSKQQTRKPKFTEIEDVWGNPHKYNTVPFGYDQGFDLLADIMAIFGGSFGGLIGTAMAGANSGGISLAQLGESLGPALEALPRLIAQKGGSKLIGRLLSQTRRQDEDENWQRLSNRHVRDNAYAAGNYTESLAAIKFVIEANYVPFLPDGTPDWNAFFAGLSKVIPITPAESETSESEMSTPAESVSGTG